MSLSDIQSACEAYIGRKFDDNDSASLRDFLRDLQVQKPRVVAKADKEEPKKFVPVSERKERLHEPRLIAPGERPAPVALTELGATPGAKDRINAYTNTVQSASSGTGVSAAEKRDDLPSVKIADRKAAYVDTVSAAPKLTSPRAEIEVGAGFSGVKDRKNAWDHVAAGSNETSKPAVVEERLAEVKGVPGVKDRLGNWTQVAEHSGSTGLGATRTEEIKGAPGVKDRLGQWDAVVAHSEKPVDKTNERLAELGSTGVKARLGGWQEIAEKDTTVASTSAGLASERTAELTRTTSIRDRMNSYNAVANAEHKIERPPVHIPLDPSELPTKESQGQQK